MVRDTVIASRSVSSALGLVPAGRFKLVVVVASLGGLDATVELLEALPDAFSVPVLLIQHRQAGADIDRLTNVLQRHTKLPVWTAHDGMLLARGTIAVVPAGFEAAVDHDSRLTMTRGQSGHAGDATMINAARAFGPAVIGVVLSGLLDDGTNGVRAIKRDGGTVMAQDPATARAGGMPAGAIATGCVDRVLSPAGIAAALVALTSAPDGPDLLAIAPPHSAKLHR